jgi:D-alanyl-D-alanine carboxypeptidase (penicillin-binding protein 5/6)
MKKLKKIKTTKLYSLLKKNKRINSTILIAVVLFFIFIISLNYSDIPEVIKKINTDTEKKQFDYESVLSNIIAKSYYVYDIKENNVIFSKNEREKLPLASVTKIMAGLVIKSNMLPTTIIDIDEESIRQEGDSGLLVNEKWTLKELLDFTLVTSSNDGMHALARALDAYKAIDGENTISLMNEKTKEIGLKDTMFLNETGLDINTAISGAYSSAYDMGKLLSYVVLNDPEMIYATAKENSIFISESNIRHPARNTNVSLNEIPTLIGSKTGFTDLAGGNLAIIIDAGISHPVAIVVLGSTQEGRFEDVESLAKMVLQKLSE